MCLHFFFQILVNIEDTARYCVRDLNEQFRVIVYFILVKTGRGNICDKPCNYDERRLTKGAESSEKRLLSGMQLTDRNRIKIIERALPPSIRLINKTHQKVSGRVYVYIGVCKVRTKNEFAD